MEWSDDELFEVSFYQEPTQAVRAAQTATKSVQDDPYVSDTDIPPRSRACISGSRQARGGDTVRATFIRYLPTPNDSTIPHRYAFCFPRGF